LGSVISLQQTSRRPQLTHPSANSASQQSSQGDAIGITHLFSNVINGVFAGSKQMYGALYPQILNVFNRSFTQRGI